MMVSIVFMANFFPIVLYPSNTKGIFTATNKIESEMPLISAVSNDMPVAPPSIKLLGNKKLSSPNAAQKMPIKIKKPFFRLLNIFCFSCIWPLAIS
jgi:hypothetical protein